MKLYNTLTKQVDEFEPINDGRVGMYTCGPTVYDFPQIGNWRTFVFEDVLRRALEYNGYRVTHVMNVTDVGHLSGDNIGNADLGEDRMEKAAKRENKTAWEIAQFYLDDFINSRDKLNILAPTFFPRATGHIQDQIDLTEKLFEKGLAYETQQGVYFDVSKFPDYGKLGGQKLVDKRVATREELIEDPEKKNPFDFALWKKTPEGEKRQMEWESPWGKGFPGWHIECSAMSMKYLGETFDIHTGGIDHVAIHHANEIAQSEGATGKPFVKFWIHGEFLTVDGGRMGKSLGNAYTLKDVTDKGFEPMALRYFYFSAHYRTLQNFTWEALESASMALKRIKNKVSEMRSNPDSHLGSEADPKTGDINWHRMKFEEAINDDLNIPNAVGAMQTLLNDKKIINKEKLETIMKFDQVFGLQLDIASNEFISSEAEELLKLRNQLRSEKKFSEADEVRKKIEDLGLVIEDSPLGSKLLKA